MTTKPGMVRAGGQTLFGPLFGPRISTPRTRSIKRGTLRLCKARRTGAPRESHTIEELFPNSVEIRWLDQLAVERYIFAETVRK
ncbi:MAG: hypothetical protein ACR2HX_01985 [Pyrinomonadaceae bacterium]